ncbi:MAG: copper amine oxidase N-terminal domain-containing protein [Clostridia bacterium]|nr:copper amine oxidase N-terminal domain-containing protein [Clostridia bacterium]
MKNLRVLFLVILLIIATFTFSICADATVVESETKVVMTIGQNVGYVNGEPSLLDAKPIIRNDRAMLPVRFVAEALGATVKWNSDTSTAVLFTDDVIISITIGATAAVVNGESITLDSPAFIENNRTYLPVRFVAESLGATVTWDGVSSTATITKPVAEETELSAEYLGIGYTVSEYSTLGGEIAYYTVRLSNGQIFRYDKDARTDAPAVNDMVFFADVNFDGINDLCIKLGNFGAQGAVTCRCYLGNSNGRYTLCESFELISNPAVDEVNKQILGTSRENAAQHWYFKYTFNGESFVKNASLLLTVADDTVELDGATYSIADGSPDRSRFIGDESEWDLINGEKWSRIIGTYEEKTEYLTKETPYYLAAKTPMDAEFPYNEMSYHFTDDGGIVRKAYLFDASIGAVNCEYHFDSEGTLKAKYTYDSKGTLIRTETPEDPVPKNDNATYTYYDDGTVKSELFSAEGINLENMSKSYGYSLTEYLPDGRIIKLSVGTSEELGKDIFYYKFDQYTYDENGALAEIKCIQHNDETNEFDFAYGVSIYRSEDGKTRMDYYYEGEEIGCIMLIEYDDFGNMKYCWTLSGTYYTRPPFFNDELSYNFGVWDLKYDEYGRMISADCITFANKSFNYTYADCTKEQAELYNKVKDIW